MISPDIEIILQNDDTIKVLISKQDDEKWEKDKYPLDAKIKQVKEDFQIEANIDFPLEQFFQEKNKEINEDLELKEFINKYEEKDISLGDIDSERFPEIIGKPFCDPFCIFCYIKKDKTVKMIKLDDRNDLEEIGPFCSYCNGNNNLFISGGDKKDGTFLEKFYKINLITKEVENIFMIPKKNLWMEMS